jgi:hypothetical protein
MRREESADSRLLLTPILPAKPVGGGETKIGASKARYLVLPRERPRTRLALFAHFPY